jgi:hypothetical protein
MAEHLHPKTMCIEAIDEYLTIAKHCITTQKENSGGIYGYPAVLLLFCVIDAVSNYIGPQHSFVWSQALFGLSPSQVKDLKEWYRHLLAHQAIIMPGTRLSTETGDPFEFGPDGMPIHIRVCPLFRAVEKGWMDFDKSKVNPTFDRNKLLNLIRRATRTK